MVCEAITRSRLAHLEVVEALEDAEDKIAATPLPLPTYMEWGCALTAHRVTLADHAVFQLINEIRRSSNNPPPVGALLLNLVTESGESVLLTPRILSELAAARVHGFVPCWAALDAGLDADIPLESVEFGLVAAPVRPVHLRMAGPEMRSLITAHDVLVTPLILLMPYRPPFLPT